MRYLFHIIVALSAVTLTTSCDRSFAHQAKEVERSLVAQDYEAATKRLNHVLETYNLTPAERTRAGLLQLVTGLYTGNVAQTSEGMRNVLTATDADSLQAESAWQQFVNIMSPDDRQSIEDRQIRSVLQYLTYVQTALVVEGQLSIDSLPLPDVGVTMPRNDTIFIDSAGQIVEVR